MAKFYQNAFGWQSQMLGEEMGMIQQCGWLKDKFGVSWQIFPAALPDMMRDPNKVKAARAMRDAMGMAPPPKGPPPFPLPPDSTPAPSPPPAASSPLPQALTTTKYGRYWHRLAEANSVKPWRYVRQSKLADRLGSQCIRRVSLMDGYRPACGTCPSSPEPQ